MFYSLKSHTIKPAKLDRALLHYNCALFEYNGVQYLIYRCQNSLRSPSWLAVSRLEADYRVTWTKRLAVDMRTAEDPRVAVVDGFVHVFYQTGAFTWPKVLATDYTIRCAKYDADFNLVSDKDLTYHGRQPCEKNWQVFHDQYTRKWYCIYSINPWRVLEFDSEWRGELIYEHDHRLPWMWGEMRGGATPVRVIPPVNVFGFGELISQYWAWFHSMFQPPKCTGAKRQYVGGLISFKDEAPFAPTGISTRPVFEPQKLDKTVVGANVIYPAGAILHKNLWRVSAGSGDCQCKVFEVMHDEVTDARNFLKIGR